MPQNLVKGEQLNSNEVLVLSSTGEMNVPADINVKGFNIVGENTITQYGGPVTIQAGGGNYQYGYAGVTKIIGGQQEYAGYAYGGRVLLRGGDFNQASTIGDNYGTKAYGGVLALQGADYFQGGTTWVVGGYGARNSGAGYSYGGPVWIVGGGADNQTDILGNYGQPGTVNIRGGAFVGFLATFADLTSAIGTGTGILLTVMIVYQFYEQIMSQHKDDIPPSIRKFLGA